MQLSGKFVEIMDVTLRDGEQTQGISFNATEKLHVAKSLLQKVKVDRIEVASARISEGEKDAVRNITKWAKSENILEKIEVLGFVDHKRSVNWINDAGGKVLNLLVKGSENHCVRQLRKTIEEHVAGIQETVEYAHKQGLTTNIYLEDWSNGYANSPEYVFRMMEYLNPFNIKHIMLPDTLGVMGPDEVTDSLSNMIKKFPWAHFDFHAHNDYGMATANSLAAVSAGISSIHCTVNCLGERAGNASLAEVSVVLKDKLDAKISVDERELGPISELVEIFSGKRIAKNTPIIGEDVFTQTSGIHADGDQKAKLYENPIHPERFGRIRSYALGKMSGKASLANNLEQMGLELSEINFKKVLNRIVELGDRKETITPADLPFIITDVLESDVFQRVRLKNCSITSGQSLHATSSVCLDIDGEEILEVGVGDGGYDSFMNAIKKILKQKGLESPKLLDYEIRIPKGGKTNAITEATITWDYKKGNPLKTIGVDSDQVFAAVYATLKMLNVKVMEELPLDGNKKFKVVS